MDINYALIRKIKEQILIFSAKNEIDIIAKNLAYPCEIKFPDRSNKQQIFFTHNNEVISIDFIHYGLETKQFKFCENEYFNLKELLSLGEIFSFPITTHKYQPNLRIGILKDINYELSCLGLIKTYKERKYLVIFGRRGETGFEENIIYIHGIWELA